MAGRSLFQSAQTALMNGRYLEPAKAAPDVNRYGTTREDCVSEAACGKERRSTSAVSDAAAAFQRLETIEGGKSAIMSALTETIVV